MSAPVQTQAWAASIGEVGLAPASG